MSSISTHSFGITDIANAPPAKGRFSGIEPFPQFGEWGRTIPIAYPGTTFRLVNWIAQMRREIRDYDELWSQCMRANPDCFADLQLVCLSKPSWFLPKGETAFQIIRNPTNIPDNPPRGVLLRHMEAMDVFGENADYYFLRPTFDSDTMEVFTGDLAREHAEQDKSDIIFMAQLYGGALRQIDLAQRLALQAVSVAEFFARKGVQGLAHVGSLITDCVERSRIKRLARENASGMHPSRLRPLIVRSLELGMFREAEIFRDELRLRDRSITSIESFHGLGQGRAAIRARSESEFVRLARGAGTDMSTVELKRVFREIESLRNWDPVLCFELKDRPGKLWLEAHWFEGTDGKTYVHY